MGGRGDHPLLCSIAAGKNYYYVLCNLLYLYRYACSMPDLTSDSVIITEGDYTMSTVSRYGVLGWVEDLPSLVVGRVDHGCGSYFRGDSQVSV
jgi:hypothetical protein